MQRQPGEGFRRAYVRPELTVHGDVGEITRSAHPVKGQADNGEGMYVNYKTGG